MSPLRVRVLSPVAPRFGSGLVDASLDLLADEVLSRTPVPLERGEHEPHRLVHWRRATFTRHKTDVVSGLGRFAPQSFKPSVLRVSPIALTSPRT